MPKALPLGFVPNVIVIVADDAPLDTYQSMPLMTANWFPSFLDYTTNGSCNTPLCLPGRASTLTGMRVENHRGWDNNEGANLDLWSTFLVASERAGLDTAIVGKWINGFGEGGAGGFGSPVRQPGVRFQRIQWGAPDYFNWTELDETGNNTTSNPSNLVLNRVHGTADGRAAYTDTTFTAYATDVEGDRVSQFLDSVPTGKPFVLYWAPKAPHKDSGSGPVPPDRHEATACVIGADPSFGLDPALYGNPGWMPQAAESPWDAATIAAVQAEHIQGLRTVRALDEVLHKTMLKLQALGKLDTTVIFLLTDNAHSYGSMRLTDKGTPHRGASSMLLKVRVPGIAGGMRYQAVSNIDIAPTVCHLIGASMPNAPDGMSMWPTFGNANAPFREAAPMSNPYKDSPTFHGLWFGPEPGRPQGGRVYYEGLPGGKAANQAGCWTDYDMIRDQGPQPDAAARLKALKITPRPD